MKRITAQLLIITCMIALACKNNQPSQITAPLAGKKGHPPLVKAPYMDTVQIGTALTNIENYAKYCNSRPFYTPNCSYAISSIDMVEMLSASGPIKTTLFGMRGYLGIEDTVLSSGDTSKVTHLYLTPMESGTKDSILMDPNGRQFLYDLTTPCPKTCDTSSVLYKAFYSVWIPKS